MIKILVSEDGGDGLVFRIPKRYAPPNLSASAPSKVYVAGNPVSFDGHVHVVRLLLGLTWDEDFGEALFLDAVTERILVCVKSVHPSR